MAIVTAIKEKTQSRAAMKKVMGYVAQDYKTNFENANGEICKLVSGQNCCGDTAFQEFMATKKQYRKESKVFFYQYVQSFKPDCGTTPQDIHQMGVELAQRFDGYEVLIATHIDRDHWHNHLVVNSVSCDTGLKLQFNEKDLEQLRTLSDEICVAHGFEILQPYQKPAMKPMGAGEYRAAVRGNSFKFQLMNAIDKAMAQSRTKGEFTACMEQMGYGVNWIPHYKNITYTTPKGKRCRDDKLHDEKYLKERMEQHFAEFERTQTIEQTAGAATDGYDALSAASQCNTDRGMGLHAQQSDGHLGTAGTTGAVHLNPADHSGYRESNSGLLSGDLRQSGRYAVQGDPRPASTDFTDGDRQDWEVGEQSPLPDAGGLPEADGAAAAPGYAAVEAKNQMGISGAAVLDSALYLAASVEDLVNPYDPDAERQKYTQEKKRRKSGKKKHQKPLHNFYDEEEMELSM